MTETRYSAVVIGGGPAGAICARELGLRGHSVALIERRTSCRSRPVELCGPRLATLLARSGILEIPHSVRHPLHALHSTWGSPDVGIRDYLFWQAGEGFSLDRNSYDSWLRSAARSVGVTLLESSCVLAATEIGREWQLVVASGNRVVRASARFVVEATGRALRSAFWRDVRRKFVDKLICLYFDIPTDAWSGASNIVLLEAAPDGWWYTCCSPGKRRILMYFTDADLVGSARARTQCLIKNLPQSFRELMRPSNIANCVVRGMDARTSIRTVLWRRSWLAIGDSAWSLDPLSGTGIEHAMSSAQDAAEAVSTALNMEKFDKLRDFSEADAAAFRSELVKRFVYYSEVARWRDRKFWARRSAAFS